MAKKGDSAPPYVKSDSSAGLPVEQWPIDKVKPYEKNPRANDKGVPKVQASIRTYGFLQPIVVDKDGVIIVGHTRHKAAKAEGMTTVPVIVAAHLSDEKARAYRLADNRTHEEADWLDDLLKEELSALKDLDFDLSLTGFDDRELQNLLVDDAELERAEQTPPVPENPVTRAGDVWLLGKHRLVCGDSTKAEDVAKALNGVKPHLMVTDPPYGINYDAAWRNDAVQAGNGKRGAPSGRAIGKVENDDRADWRETWSLFPGDVAYVWHAGTQSKSVIESLEAAGFDLRAQIIWAKNNIVIGRGHYHPQHEPCWYAVRKKQGATGHWCGARDQSTLWKIDKPQKSETGHSTQKPVECMRRPIMNNSSEGQAVYDPFLGSGTTLISAEMTGRACHGLELNPAYCDVICLRYMQFSGGGEAVLEETGQSFADVARSRGVKDYDAQSSGLPSNDTNCTGPQGLT